MKNENSVVQTGVEEMLRMFDDRSLFDIGSYDEGIQSEVREEIKQVLTTVYEAGKEII